MNYLEMRMHSKSAIFVQVGENRSQIFRATNQLSPNSLLTIHLHWGKS